MDQFNRGGPKANMFIQYPRRRVKAVFFTASQKPWIAMSFYSGLVFIWKNDENSASRFLASLNEPVRACISVEA
jgi:hypothetical protein